MSKVWYTVNALLQLCTASSELPARLPVPVYSIYLLERPYSYFYVLSLILPLFSFEIWFVCTCFHVLALYAINWLYCYLSILLLGVFLPVYDIDRLCLFFKWMSFIVYLPATFVGCWSCYLLIAIAYRNLKNGFFFLNVLTRCAKIDLDRGSRVRILREAK